VLDFKGSEFTEAEAPTLKTWDEHAMQLAATREALQKAPCRVRDRVRVPQRARSGAIIRVDEEDLVRGWDMFRGLLNYWQAKSSYWPALWKEKEAA
jgi:hypothetical protein